MKTKVFTFLSVFGIFIILISQGITIYNSYTQSRAFLIKEIDVILETAFRRELSLRVNKYHQLEGDTLEAPRVLDKKKVVSVDMSQLNNIADNSLGKIDLAINHVISTRVPIDIKRLDSIVGGVITKRNIQSSYFTKMLDAQTGKVIESSNNKNQLTFFSISSRLLLIDFQRQQSLQIVLSNPFIPIFEQMGILMISSVLISLFCFYGLLLLFTTQLRQKKLMAVKNDFFGNTAHELKRPVAQLHLALEALSKSSIFDNVEKRDRYLSISQAATKDMTQKINMIMTLSMAEEGVFKLNYSHFNLFDEVLKLREQFSAVAGKEIEIIIDAKDQNVIVNADKDHMCQCIANLIDNAIKYSGVSVAITITLHKLKDALRLSVSDNGIGIESDKMKRIFDKYFRINAGDGMPDGFGIGLSYVKAVVEKHEGRVEVSSEHQHGSEFRLYLPM